MTRWLFGIPLIIPMNLPMIVPMNLPMIVPMMILMIVSMILLRIPMNLPIKTGCPLLIGGSSYKYLARQSHVMQGNYPAPRRENSSPWR